MALIFTTRASMEDAYHPQTILAYELNDAVLLIANGATRLRVERQLGYKHAKYVMRISWSDPTRSGRQRRLLGGPGISGSRGYDLSRSAPPRDSALVSFATSDRSNGMQSGRSIASLPDVFRCRRVVRITPIHRSGDADRRMCPDGPQQRDVARPAARGCRRCDAPAPVVWPAS